MRAFFRHQAVLSIAVACIALLAACAPRPVATTWPATVQPKMQAAQHWDMLAADVVDELSAKMPPASAGLIEVREPAIATDFSEGFRTFLTTRLNDAGYRVALAGGQTAVEFRTQVVSHFGGDRDKRPPPGTFTLLGGAVALGDWLADHWSDPVLAGSGIAFGVALDAAAGAFTSRSDTEIIESVSIVDRGVIDFQKAYVFYINTDQRAEYEYVPPPPPPPPGPATVQIGPNPELAQVWADADRHCDGTSGAVLRRVAPNEGGPSERRFGCWERY
jgi:hypothetical protein